MRLGLKLAALLLVAAAAPLLLALTFTLPSSRESLERQVRDFHVQTADLMAREANAAVLEKVQALVLWSNALKFTELDAEEQRDALRLIYRQTQDADIVGLFDDQGAALVEEVFLADPEAHGLGREHERVGEAELSAYAHSVPLAAALESGAAVGPVYVLPDAAGEPIPRVVVALALKGKPEPRRWVLALEISLRPLVNRFSKYHFGNTGRAFLVDGEGRLIAHPDGALRGTKYTPPGEGDTDALGAQAQVPLMGWSVHVEQSTDEALAAVQQQAGRATFWVGAGLGLALVLGMVAVRTVTRPMGRLRHAALRVAEGDLSAEVDIRGKDELAMLGRTFNEMTRGLRERERLRESFGRYVSGEIANRILSEENDLELKGELVEATVLFLDIRGFTSLAERHDPRQVIDLVNLYFEQAVRVVIHRGGVINKFLGDGILAVFGLKRHDSEAVQAAVQAALEIQRKVSRFNESRRAAGLLTVSFGIGINTGRLIAGNVGTAERMEYTVIGDTVNVAQRLQSHAANGAVLLGAETRARLGTAFVAEPCGVLQVKGREKPVEVFAVSDGNKPVNTRAAG